MIEFLPPVSLASVGTYVVDRIFVFKAVKTGEAQVGEGFSYFSYSYLTRCFSHNTPSISHIHTGPSICRTHTELGISHTHTRQNIPHTHTGPSISHTLKKRYFSHLYWTKYFAYTHWRKNFSYKYWSLDPVSLTGIAVPRWRMYGLFRGRVHEMLRPISNLQKP